MTIQSVKRSTEFGNHAALWLSKYERTGLLLGFPFFCMLEKKSLEMPVSALVDHPG